MKVTIDGVAKSFGRQHALEDVSIELPDGELVALLGPSGSGKTTILRVLAGIETPDRGRVLFGDVDVTDRPIRERNVGFVFQDYALFDHMTVAENIGFGLKVRKIPRVAARVRELLALVQLEGIEKRYPRQLSGGQRQRVALARALAPEPEILLLDEPFGALDARVRRELAAWLRRLHDEIGVTSVFVTHDQEEALEVADRLVVMRHGRVEQVGDPETVFDAPANAFVIDFLGEVNVLHGRVEGGRGVFGALRLPPDGAADGTGATAYIRSQDVGLARVANGAPCVPAVISHVRRVGLAVRVRLEADVGELVAELPHHDWQALGVGRGDTVVASVRRARLFPRDS